MRTVGHLEGETSSLQLDERTAGTARTSVASGPIVERHANSESANSGSFVGLLSRIERPKPHTGSAQQQSLSDAPRHPVTAALSWLAACLIEGFAAYGHAAYGHAIYPGFVDPLGIDDHHEPSRGSQGQSEHESEAPCPIASYPRATPGGWIERVKSAVVRVWSSMRSEWQVRRTMTELCRLDDRTLKDIGLHRCQIGSAGRDRDHYDRWDHSRW